MVYSTSESIAGRPYSVASALVDPTRAQLASVPRLAKTAALDPDLKLPASYRAAALKKLADSNTSGQASEFGKVNALATWLSGPQFTYSLDARNLTSEASLVDFLTKVKSGFCVQYAYAMTVLTRLLGIPARFVVGYTGGTRLADGSYQVRNIDAHAWTEVYFPTLGWIRFEPTPAGQGTANAPNYMTGGAGHGQLGANPIISATAAGGRPQVPAAGQRGRPPRQAGRHRRDAGGRARAGRYAVGGDRAGRDRRAGAGVRPGRDRGPAGPAGSRPAGGRPPAPPPRGHGPGRDRCRGGTGGPGPVPAAGPHGGPEPRRRLGRRRHRVRRHRGRRADRPGRVPPGPAPLAVDAGRRRHRPRARRLARVPR